MNVFGTYTDSISTPLLGGECGKRLIPNVIDLTASATPDVECLSVPRSPGNPSAGWKPVSWAQVANAVNYVAHMLIAEAGVPTPGTFPTVTYIGLEDPRYPIFAIGAIKAGYKALFISPRNSTEAQVNLFNKTDSNLLYHAAELASMVQPWVDGRPGMKRVVVAPWDDWVYTEVAPFPYNKTFEEAEWDPFVVLHTSGSTGLPKPVIIPQGKLALNDLHRYVPEYEGNMPWLAHWAKFPNTRYLCIFPLFHTGGIAPMLLMAFYYNAVIAFRDPSVPITGDNVVEWLKNTGAGWTLIPPAVLEQMSRSEVAVEELKKLHAVGFAGGPIAPVPAENLLSHNVKLVNAIGATEFIYMPYYNNPDPTLWPWFIIPSELMGIDWRPSGQENTYEQVIIRKNKDHPGSQGCFYVFPDQQEFSTKDLYRPHPTLANHWTYVGRADDILVFSNGEKLNPTTIEGAVMGHPGVRGAQVVGTGYFHAALIVEPANHPQTEQEKQQFLDDLWPIVEKVNVETVAHGRISRDYMFLSDAERPFPRAGKGTIQRAMVVKVYSEDIDRIFTTTSDASVVAVDIDLTSREAFDTTMRKLVQNVLKQPTLCMDQDFFAAGADSLQAIQLARSLRVSLEKATDISSTATIDAQTIYSHPTIDQLASFAYSLATTTAASPTAADDTALCTALLEKYTHSLPAANPSKLPTSTTAQTLLITGTTGTLGPYLLSTALSNPDIARIICLNRDPNAATRQLTTHANLSLSTDFSRVEFHTADLTHPTLALTPETYASLLQNVDRIIHNAWPVNFNLSLSSFEPSIKGVRHLIDLSAASHKTVPITFISSVSAVANWSFPDQSVPEGALEDWTLAAPGYGQSKLLASLLLDTASQVSGVPCSIIRVGQVAGPRGDKGMWNVKEWVPSLIRSSVYLGLLPGDLGGLGAGLGWICVEDVVGVILEVAVEEKAQGAGYFHAVNPHTVDWQGLVPGLCEFYGERIQKVVSLREWVEALEKSLESMREEDVEANRGVKLLSTFKEAAGLETVRTVAFETARTELVSPTMRGVKPVTPELMQHWCEQWQF